MPSPDKFAQVNDSGIEEIDWINASHLPKDPKSQIPQIDFEYLPASIEERGFHEVAQTLGLTEDIIDVLAPNDRMYYASLSTAVGNCAISGPNGELLEPGEDIVLGLHNLDTGFLQAFSFVARAERHRLLKDGDGYQTAFASAERFFEHILDTTTALHNSN